jgi:hypothetical protein
VGRVGRVDKFTKVLSIANLRFIKGLLSSMTKIDLFEYIREKRLFVKFFSPTSDEPMIHNVLRSRYSNSFNTI